jgi:hypothetical protein
MENCSKLFLVQATWSLCKNQKKVYRNPRVQSLDDEFDTNIATTKIWAMGWKEINQS